MRSVEQKLEREANVAQQRMVFEQQLLEPSLKIEIYAQQNQVDLEEKLQTQITQALQARTASIPDQHPPPVSLSPALTNLLENQSQQLIMLTQMMATMSQCNLVSQNMSNYSAALPPRVHPTSGLKRSSDVIVVDLTSPDTSQTRGAQRSQGHADRKKKKQDNKGTPSAKDAVSPHSHAPSHGMQRPQMPVSMNTSMSVITPQGRATPPPLLAVFILLQFTDHHRSCGQSRRTVSC